MIMETLFCQSCGMPLTGPEVYGTEADGAFSADYCTFCYKDGSFTAEMTMAQMIDHCAQYLDEFNQDSGPQLSREQAVEQMKQYFPTLKRWRRA
jgi:hypothetical protein